MIPGPQAQGPTGQEAGGPEGLDQHEQAPIQKAKGGQGARDQLGGGRNGHCQGAKKLRLGVSDGLKEVGHILSHCQMLF